MAPADTALSPVTDLKRAIAGTADPTARGLLHLELGRLLEQDLSRRTEALQEYQRAFRWNPGAIEAVRRARAIYAELGKAHVVAQLIEIELQHATTAAEAVALLATLASILADLGEVDKARACLVRSLELDPTHVATLEALEALDAAEDE